MLIPVSLGYLESSANMERVLEHRNRKQRIILAS